MLSSRILPVRRCALAAAGVVCGLVLSLAVAQTPDAPHSHEDCGKVHAARLRHAAGMSPADVDVPGGGFGPRGDLDQTDVLHNNIDLEVFPASETIAGRNTMTLRSLVNGLSQFTFRLRSNLTITQALINDTTNVPPASIQASGSYGRLIPLDRAYAAGEEFSLTIVYNGPAVSRGFGSIEFDTQNGNPIVWTLSEPYYAATWWPCKDADFGGEGDNADKATFELAITAPSNMTSVSNGLLVGVDDLAGDRRRFRWATNYPMPTYLAFFCSTVYNQWAQTYTYSLPGGGTATMPVQFSIYPASDSPGNRAAWELCIPMLDTFRSIYGLYPFINEKYGIYQFGFGGGMEHQTYTGQGGFGESLTAHELAHQWWGDNVTCRTWHDIWLNEGFARYSEALWFERKPGSSGLPALHNAMANRRPSSVNGSVYVYDTTDFSRIFSSTFSYAKGGWVLHMLRHVVSDAVFFQILENYRAAFQGSAATTDDFASIVSQTVGADLSYFFDQWVYDIGAPTYAFASQPAVINGQHYVRLYLAQTQTTAYPLFRMPIDVRIDRAGGNQTVVIRNDAVSEHFLLPVSAAATNVVIDEFNWILNEGKNAVAWVNGPPKVVELSPPPGASFGSDAGPASVSIGLSEGVTIAAADVSVTSDGAAVPFTFAYQPGELRATLQFSAPLPAGIYSLTVSDSVVSAAAGIALDGEVPGTTLIGGSALPSGDGLAGGDAAWTIRVGDACLADLDADGAVDLADLATLLSNFGTPGGAAASQGDLNGDGQISLSDLTIMLSVFGATCE